MPPDRVDPDYAGFEMTEGRLARGVHRSFVGGQWDEMGQLQLDFLNDLRWVAKRSPWSFRYIGDWNHPRGQRIVEYTRLPD